MRAQLSAAEARRVALAAQGFARSARPDPGTRQIQTSMARMATLQIDSVNVFARSHYLPIFSRLGSYDTSALDRLMFSQRGPYTEYWAHVAALIPADDWNLFAFRMEEMRGRPGPDGETWLSANRTVVDWVRSELAERGPLRPAEIEFDARTSKRGGWWQWDVVKQALERMWLAGDVAIAGRRGFERRYGLVEDVLPASALARTITRAEAIHELVRRASRAYGVATAADLADYWRIADRRAVIAAANDLVDAGELTPVTVEGWTTGGRPTSAWLRTDQTIPRRIQAATVLTPFDPVVWFRDRAQRLFDFEYRIEIYTPAPKRRFGYYSLPMLLDDDIVGRVDLKADRQRSTLLVQSAWWEHGRPADAAPRLAAHLHQAAAWQGLESISVSHWGDATADLADALTGAARHTASVAV